MDKIKIAKNARTIQIKKHSNIEFFIIHGYTGSPTDFHHLPQYLSKRFNANVIIPRLKGHGTQISNLDKLNYEDFYNDLERYIEKNEKNKTIFIGLSLGGFMALELASKFKNKGIVIISIPYKLIFPVNIISFFERFIIKKKWKKPIPSYEGELRKKAFNYDYVHVRGLKILKESIQRFEVYCKKIKTPVLAIYAEGDFLTSIKSDKAIRKKIKSKIKTVLFSSKEKMNHNIFYSPMHEEIYENIGDFIEENLKK